MGYNGTRDGAGEEGDRWFGCSMLIEPVEGVLRSRKDSRDIFTVVGRVFRSSRNSEFNGMTSKGNRRERIEVENIMNIITV